jgi:hypothetical protein
MVTLTVKNYANWCGGFTIIVGANAFGFNASTGSASAPSGSTVTVEAQGVGNGFVLGPDPWLSGTTQDDGGVAPGTFDDAGGIELSNAKVLIGAGPTQCVSLCCPSAGDLTECNGIGAQCP